RHWSSIPIPITILALTATAAILAAIGAIYHYYNETRTNLHRLEQLLTEVRAGQATIDELSSIGGIHASILLHIQDLLRDMLRPKGEVFKAEHEMRHRLAQRTSAMERLIGSLRVQANRDSLTGLYNRRMLEKHLGTVLEEARATANDLCLLILDLD